LHLNNRIARVEERLRRRPSRRQLAEELSRYIGAIYGSPAEFAQVASDAYSAAGFDGADPAQLLAIIEEHLGAKI
jgi:hypothetical protein